MCLAINGADVEIEKSYIAYNFHSPKCLLLSNFYGHRSSRSWVITKRLGWLFVRDELRNCAIDIDQIL